MNGTGFKPCMQVVLPFGDGKTKEEMLGRFTWVDPRAREFVMSARVHIDPNQRAPILDLFSVASFPPAQRAFSAITEIARLGDVRPNAEAAVRFGDVCLKVGKYKAYFLDTGELLVSEDGHKQGLAVEVDGEETFLKLFCVDEALPTDDDGFIAAFDNATYGRLAA